MELKIIYFGISVRLISGANKGYINVTQPEFKKLRMFHLGHAVRIVDTDRNNAVMYVPSTNVCAFVPINNDGFGEEIFSTRILPIPMDPPVLFVQPDGSDREPNVISEPIVKKKRGRKVSSKRTHNSQEEVASQV